MAITLAVIGILALVIVVWLAYPLAGIFRPAMRPTIHAVLGWEGEVLVADLSLVSLQGQDVVPVSIRLAEESEYEDSDEDYGVAADQPLPVLRGDGRAARVAFTSYSRTEGARGTIEIGVADRRRMGPLTSALHSTTGVPVDIPLRPA